MPQRLAAEERLYVSTVAVQGDRDLGTVLARLHGLGIDRVELSAPHPYQEHGELSELLGGWRDRGMAFVVHNYFPRPRDDFILNIASADPAVREASLAMVAWAFELGREIDSPLYGCHAGYLADSDIAPDGSFVFDDSTLDGFDACLDRAVSCVRAMLASANGNLGEDGLLLENLFPVTVDQSYSLACTPEEIRTLFDAVEDDRVGLLLDLAHFFIMCRQRERDPDRTLETLMDLVGDRLRAIHMSGNDGSRDSHDPVAEDSWMLGALRRIADHPGPHGRGLKVTLESRRMEDDQLRRQKDLLLDAMN